MKYFYATPPLHRTQGRERKISGVERVRGEGPKNLVHIYIHVYNQATYKKQTNFKDLSCLLVSKPGDAGRGGAGCAQNHDAIVTHLLLQG